MSILKSAVSILASASVAAGGTKVSPQAGGNGSSVDVRTYYGGELTWKITNSGSAPTVAMTITIQISDDGTKWFDFQTVAGDTVASSVTSGCVTISRGVMYVKALAYGNATNAVTAEVMLQAVTGI